MKLSSSAFSAFLFAAVVASPSPAFPTLRPFITDELIVWLPSGWDVVGKDVLAEMNSRLAKNEDGLVFAYGFEGPLVELPKSVRTIIAVIPRLDGRTSAGAFRDPAVYKVGTAFGVLTGADGVSTVIKNQGPGEVTFDERRHRLNQKLVQPGLDGRSELAVSSMLLTERGSIQLIGSCDATDAAQARALEQMIDRVEVVPSLRYVPTASDDDDYKGVLAFKGFVLAAAKSIVQLGAWVLIFAVIIWKILRSRRRNTE